MRFNSSPSQAENQDEEEAAIKVPVNSVPINNIRAGIMFIIGKRKESSSMGYEPIGLS